MDGHKKMTYTNFQNSLTISLAAMVEIVVALIPMAPKNETNFIMSIALLG